MTLSELLKSTRQHFWKQNFEEVEIPYLNESLPLEPNIYSFKTTWTHTSTNYFLPVSPEFALKKYLSETKKNCFAISHCFRDLESSGPHHHPEFLMLEYYLVDKSLDELKESLKEYISQFLKIDFIEMSLPSNLPDNEPDFNQWFLNEFEPTIPTDKAVFVTGYPSFLSPLAKQKEDGVDSLLRNHNEDSLTGAKNSSTNPLYTRTSNRFELYLNCVEIANGCEENLNSEQILQSFINEKEYRLKHQLPLHPHSTEFANICHLNPKSSGVGIGLERLLMVINQQESL